MQGNNHAGAGWNARDDVVWIVCIEQVLTALLSIRIDPLLDAIGVLADVFTG